jgi:hypothetical protein
VELSIGIPAFPMADSFLSLGEVHMSTKQYVKFARECMRWAEESSSENDRQHFLEMAKAWMRAVADTGGLGDTAGTAELRRAGGGKS